MPPLHRRDFLAAGAAGLAAATGFSGRPLPARAEKQPAGGKRPFQLKFIVGSCMYGTTALEEILPEVRRTGASQIDIWPLRHGNQREQIEKLGHDRLAELLEQHQVEIGILTHYDLGPFGLQADLPLATRFKVPLMVTGSKGPKNLAGAELKQAVRTFAEQLKPHSDVLGEAGVTIAIENHSGSLVNTPDSIRWFADAVEQQQVGVALAPYHLPQDPAELARLITDLGPKLVHFYAWEHGMGCMTRLPKDQELMQLPGRGPLDFGPLVQALKTSGYSGWTEVFMHPVPRGIPILPETKDVTAAINAARAVLEQAAEPAADS
ncbi:MAG: sugar phosphate isomerase/epimerase [Planctomycetaceae bacterium]|nr:sugar phosphate isomerase/epimerase [Planctomycetaceae bacterium]